MHLRPLRSSRSASPARAPRAVSAHRSGARRGFAAVALSSTALLLAACSGGGETVVTVTSTPQTDGQAGQGSAPAQVSSAPESSGGDTGSGPIVSSAPDSGARSSAAPGSGAGSSAAPASSAPASSAPAPSSASESSAPESSSVAAAPVTLLDRSGAPLMSHQTVQVISVDPSKITDKAGTAATMAKALQPIDASFTTASLQKELSGSAPFTLVSLRTTTAADAIDTLTALPGVTAAAQRRFLVDNPELTSPVFTQLTSAVNSGTALGSGKVRTSLDSGIQLAAQKALQDSKYPAAIVAIQPSTGGILAVAQNSKADALGPIALNGLYPPGSTFKTITVAAALAGGKVTAQTPLACPATANLEGRLIPNENKFALGTVPLTTAFAQSCNTTIAGLGVKLAPNQMSDTAKQFGLGVDYVIPGITTVTGKVPTASTSFQRVEEAIGQWQVVASPFGMALTGATVAAGKLPTPTLVSGTKTVADQQPPPLSSSVVEQLQTMFKATVSDGTAEALKNIGGVGGKTGTAQYGDGTNSHGWFVGTNKDMAFAVLLVGGQASKNAVSTAGDFLRGAQKYLPGR